MSLYDLSKDMSVKSVSTINEENKKDTAGLIRYMKNNNSFWCEKCYAAIVIDRYKKIIFSYNCQSVSDFKMCSGCGYHFCSKHIGIQEHLLYFCSEICSK
jgi:hypothetical protein